MSACIYICIYIYEGLHNIFHFKAAHGLLCAWNRILFPFESSNSLYVTPIYKLGWIRQALNMQGLHEKLKQKLCSNVKGTCSVFIHHLNISYNPPNILMLFSAYLTMFTIISITIGVWCPQICILCQDRINSAPQPTIGHYRRYWRNWYQVWGHGCDTTDSQMSPQLRRSRDCGDIWESVVSQPWPKTRYQFLFYHGTTKLTLD